MCSCERKASERALYCWTRFESGSLSRSSVDVAFAAAGDNEGTDAPAAPVPTAVAVDSRALRLFDLAAGLARAGDTRFGDDLIICR